MNTAQFSVLLLLVMATSALSHREEQANFCTDITIPTDLTVMITTQDSFYSVAYNDAGRWETKVRTNSEYIKSLITAGIRLHKLGLDIEDIRASQSIVDAIKGKQ